MWQAVTCQRTRHYLTSVPSKLAGQELQAADGCQTSKPAGSLQLATLPPTATERTKVAGLDACLVAAVAEHEVLGLDVPALYDKAEGQGTARQQSEAACMSHCTCTAGAQ